MAFALGGPAAGQTPPPADANDPNAQTVQAPAQNPDPNLAGQSGGSTGIPELLPRMMLSILLVIGLGAAAFYLSKKVLPKMVRGSAKEIRIVETVYLGPRKALHLVEVGHQKLLIGSTYETITPLATVSDAWLDLPKSPADDVVNL